MSTYRVKTSMTIPACEEFLRAIDSAVADVELLIPSNIVHSFAGGEASFAQAICTWARRQGSAKLRTFAEGVLDPQIEKISLHLYGLVACLNADCVVDKHDVEITKEMRQESILRIRKLQEHNPYSLNRGNEVQILCADHLGLGFPETLYAHRGFGSPRLRDRAEFQYVARQLAKKLVNKRLEDGWTSEVVSALGSMLYEVFRNTEDHGMRDLDKNRLMHSMRGVHAKFYSLLPEKMASISEGYGPLESFCVSLTPDSGHKQVTFLELSVFDSGIGFAPSWLKQSLESIMLNRELDAIQECFQLGKSRKIQDGYGIGLPRVVKFLKGIGGFLRLRTGRYSLYYDFSTSNADEDFPRLKIWTPNSSESLPSVAGALLTLVIPLRRQGAFGPGELG